MFKLFDLIENNVYTDKAVNCQEKYSFVAGQWPFIELVKYDACIGHMLKSICNHGKISIFK